MRTAFVLLTALLVGCSEQTERTYTVDELVANEGFLSDTITKCRNNTGGLHNTANCRNAEAADFKLGLLNMQKALGG